jgi:secondary thiamine-phosphate synthase enzyme
MVKSKRFITLPFRYIFRYSTHFTPAAHALCGHQRTNLQSFMHFFQKSLTLIPKSRGFHLITDEITVQLAGELRHIRAGVLHVFIQHTSASLTINENADPAVRQDFETHFNRAVPEDTSLYRHTLEGTDDMTSHIKSSILGSSVSIPVTDGSLNLGTWQGIYLCEHRNNGGRRKVVVTLWGK